jgi:hypothetical protein
VGKVKKRRVGGEIVKNCQLIQKSKLKEKRKKKKVKKIVIIK